MGFLDVAAQIGQGAVVPSVSVSVDAEGGVTVEVTGDEVGGHSTDVIDDLLTRARNESMRVWLAARHAKEEGDEDESG